MVVLLALALVLLGPAKPRLTVHLSIDQAGTLSALQLRLAIDEVRKIWREAGVTVTSGRYGEPHLGVGEATISLRILLASPPVANGAERILAWVTPGKQAGTAPLLFVSLPAVVETVSNAVALDRPVARLTNGMRDRLIARALGRVAAHELGHYLLQNAPHETNGLMRPQYSANELVGDWLEPFTLPNAAQLVVHQEIQALARVQASEETSAAPIADAADASTSVPNAPPLALAVFAVLAGSSDPAIARALELLGDAAPAAPTVVVHRARPVATMSLATAWTDGHTIFVNDQSEPYKHAMNNAIALAGALAHEGFHIVNGPAEAPAYTEQLRVMRNLGARKADIEAVERGLSAAELAAKR